MNSIFFCCISSDQTLQQTQTSSVQLSGLITKISLLVLGGLLIGGGVASYFYWAGLPPLIAFAGSGGLVIASALLCQCISYLHFSISERNKGEETEVQVSNLSQLEDESSSSKEEAKEEEGKQSESSSPSSQETENVTSSSSSEVDVEEYIRELKQSAVAQRLLPSHLAAFENDAYGLELLFDSENNLNIVDANGTTPLHIAAQEAWEESVLYLVDEARVDVTFVDKEGNTALHYLADKMGYPDPEEDDNERMPTKIAEFLIMQKLLVAAVNNNGDTPLHLAALNGRFELVDIFLNAAIDKAELINLQDKQGETALHHAVREGNLAVIQMLVENGAEINAVNERKETPLSIFINESETYKPEESEVAIYLKEQGAIIEEEDIL